MKQDQIVIYQTEDGQTQIDVRLENETVWLTQAQMAELFETDRTSIVRHINNIYKVDELDRESTCAKIAQVQIEGKRTVKRNIPYFNLDMIISMSRDDCPLPSTPHVHDENHNNKDKYNIHYRVGNKIKKL